jgi:lysophospholipase L1-like esterase
MTSEVSLDESYFQGVLSVERTAEGLRPWRLPHTKRHWFLSPDDGLMGRAGCTSGVRLRFETEATALTLRFRPLEEPGPVIPDRHCFDAVIDDRIIQVVRCGGGAEEAVFDTIGHGRRVVELWLPPGCPVTITGLLASDAATVRAVPDPRPLWVTWGSSITQCVRAGSAARTWPATVARRHGLNLLNLGYGGQCYLDPAVALVIRDLPARYLSLKLGINAAISSNLNERTYQAMVAAAVAIIREKQPCTPLALVSPIGFPRHETAPNAVGYTVTAMRRDLATVHRCFVEAGDPNLHHVDGLAIFTVDEIGRYTRDQCHPNAEGIDLMADRFSALVMSRLMSARQ